MDYNSSIDKENLMSDNYQMTPEQFTRFRDWLWDCQVPFEYLSHDSEGQIAYVFHTCLLYTSPSPRDLSTSRMPSSA